MTQARVIDGRAIASQIRSSIAEAAARLRDERSLTPGLATILVGNDPASKVYVQGKSRACIASGLATFELALPEETPEAALIAEVEKLNADDRVDGILIQLPLPRHINPHRVIAAIDPAKDVDGLHPLNVGRLWSGLAGLVPCTPQGCLALLRTAYDDLSGADAVVLGRSSLVGKPLAALLVASDCTVTIVHSRSRDAVGICRRADILVAAAGRPQMVKAEWIKPGATVIDVGTSSIALPDGGRRVVGDVDFEAACAVARAITPVPGGVGPMTIACLLRNTLLAACRRRGLPDPLL